MTPISEVLAGKSPILVQRLVCPEYFQIADIKAPFVYPPTRSSSFAPEIKSNSEVSDSQLGVNVPLEISMSHNKNFKLVVKFSKM